MARNATSKHFMKINPDKTEILLLCPASLNFEVLIKGVIRIIKIEGEIFSFVSVCTPKWCICKMVIYEMNEKYLLLDICILADISRNLFYLWHVGKFQLSIVYMLLVPCQRCTNLK